MACGASYGTNLTCLSERDADDPWPCEVLSLDHGNGDATASHADTSTHVGAGPRGYHPDDVLCYDVICRALTDAPQIDARNIMVYVDQGTVRLNGTVPDGEQRAAVNALMVRLVGDDAFINHLRIQQLRQAAAPLEPARQSVTVAVFEEPPVIEWPGCQAVS